ncbi:MAG: alpha-amylase family glycosyl hydrolase [Deinococcales bacterium]
MVANPLYLNLAEKPLATLDDGLAGADRLLFRARCERYLPELIEGLYPLYGERDDFESWLAKSLKLLAHHVQTRPQDLKDLDLKRDLNPDWFQAPDIIGYVFYGDRFAGSLKGIIDRLDYLSELGVRYVHVMPCLKMREGENDGGYAVIDYKAIDPSLGDIDDLEALTQALRARNMSLCIDLVLNHCAKEHPWAKAALAGDKHYQDYFYVFPDRTLPDRYEESLLEIFPDFAPGNFSHYPIGWVWTTFNEYQWDLNWTNPQIFLEVLDILLFLANKGVEVFRLDAVAFMWKRLGTVCQNEAEVHAILQALRAASRIAAPAVIHKAEAIVSPDKLIPYLGTGEHYGKVSNLAYHNSLMVQYWSSLASRDTKLMSYVLKSFPKAPPSSTWVSYLRCHDDIGWAVTDEDAAAVGLNGFFHRKFLSDYYAGDFPGSHALGAVFQYNPQTQDKRISGSFAALVGLEKS